MSHFFTLAIVQKDVSDIQAELERLFAPYNENTDVPEYERDCWCVGRKAQNDSSEQMQAEMGTWDEAKRQFRARELSEEDANKAWKTDVYGPRESRVAELVAVHPLNGQPDPECDECKGTGKEKTTYNPKSKWDWWCVGGRWTGTLDDYDPESDPDNIETCDMCGGTGDRATWRRESPIGQHPSGCNGCLGKGKRSKWPTQFKEYAGDIMPLSKLPNLIPDDKIPFAIITPDGEWHERGHMGWFAMVTNEKDDWKTRAASIINKHRDCIGVVCDLHI